MKNILQSILATFARLMLKRYKPKVIGITGNVGKTSVKNAVFAVLSSQYHVRQSEKNYNNEIGVPLTILGIPSSGKNIFGWGISLLKVLTNLIHTKYPKILILEMGVDKPGDMKYLLSIVKPHIAVFAAMGDIPAHVEFFKNPDSMVREKSELAFAVARTGFVIINNDIEKWSLLKQKAKAHKITYGFFGNPDIKMNSLKERFDNVGDTPIPLGITHKVEYRGNVVPIRLNGVVGSSGAYAAGAACAVGIALGMHLVEASFALQKYTMPPGRMHLIKGMKNSLIIDDTYNAAPHAMHAALDALAHLPATRKIAVLGDMLELGTYTEEAHKSVGERASAICDIVYTVGNKMRFAANMLVQKDFIVGKSLISFNTAQEAAQQLEKIVQRGDMILVKGSQGMRMEKVVKQIMAYPEKAKELLVRQDKKWLKK